MTEPATDRVVVGRVRGLHGLRGRLRVEVLTDQPEERFVAGRVLHPEGSDRVLTVESAAPVADGPGWWLTLREVGDRAGAETLRDAFLEAEVARAEALEPGEVFWHEVVGARVEDESGRALGVVSDVYRAGVAEVYVVRDGPVGEFDLPAIRDVIREFAPEQGLIVIDANALALEERPVDDPVVPSAARRRPRWSRHGKGGGPA